MRRSKIAGMIKYGTVKEALQKVKKDTERHHTEFMKKLSESINEERKARDVWKGSFQPKPR